uniref:Uncharacterized protein n=1 Tax=Strongyloides venezuelensis TaxID=75913 RepID=A0A0K0F6R2_STRVS
MNHSESNNLDQSTTSNGETKIREASIEFNTQCHRYKLEIEELKVTIKKLEELNNKAHKRIYKLEQENECLNGMILELEEKIDYENRTISNLIIKNGEMKELNEMYMKELGIEKGNNSRLSIRPSEEALVNTLEKQKKVDEDEIENIRNSRNILKHELDTLQKKYSSVEDEYLQSKEELCKLREEINELKEREDVMKMEIGSLKLQLSTKNQKALFERINDDPELKKYFNNQQMKLEHLEIENDSMHEMYQLMFKKIKDQLGREKCNNNEEICDDNILSLEKEKEVVCDNKIHNKNASLSYTFCSPCKNCSGKIEIA